MSEWREMVNVGTWGDGECLPLSYGKRSPVDGRYVPENCRIG